MLCLDPDQPTSRLLGLYHGCASATVPVHRPCIQRHMANMETTQLQQLAILRTVVGYLGERDQSAWWQSSFFGPSSRAFLQPIFARTELLAQYNGVTRAAALVHDDRIGVGQALPANRRGHGAHILSLEATWRPLIALTESQIPSPPWPSGNVGAGWPQNSGPSVIGNAPIWGID